MADQPPADVIQYAAQLGRLDLVSVSLAILAILMGLGGLVAFLDLRSTAKRHARREARILAEATAERVTNEYLQRELPKVIKAYIELERDSSSFSQVNEDASANAIAAAQDDGGQK